MNTNKKKHLFGPVPSRRFGRSLGIDMLPYKTCSFDCVFCQLGPTTHRTVNRDEYVPTADVILELKNWLESGGEADYLTLSGSGEPTLHSHFGDILTYIRSHSNIPSVLLTNGSLLHLPEVREAACLADIVKVSLSAWDDASYRAVNRADESLSFKQLVEGQKIFRNMFTGELWQEVILLDGINASEEAVQNIAQWAEEIAPDRIHINTVVRPPAESFANPVTEARLLKLAEFFGSKAEVIANSSQNLGTEIQANKETILEMLKRRPCTALHISEAFSLHANEVSKYLGQLVRSGHVQVERTAHEVYYTAKKSSL